MTLTEALVQLLEELSDRGSPIVGQLRPGLSAAEVKRHLTGQYPVMATDELIEWFAFADGLWVPWGVLNPPAQLFPGYVPMSIEAAIAARRYELAFAGGTLLGSLASGDPPFITTSLDCLPILSGQPVISMKSGTPQAKESPGGLYWAEWGEEFAQVEPDLATWATRVVEELRSGDLVVDPFGTIHNATYAPPNLRRDSIIRLTFGPGTLHCSNSGTSAPLDGALAQFATLAERCGSVSVEGYPEGSVPGNRGAEPEQVQEVSRLLQLFGVPSDQITTSVVEPEAGLRRHTVTARVTIPVPPRPRPRS